MSGYRVGPTLAGDERPWPVSWEQDPRIDDGHSHDWETCLLGAAGRLRHRVEEVVRCASCHAPRCGNSTDPNPCMERRHHRGVHIYLNGPKVRTHSVYRLSTDTLDGGRAEQIVCRGCGKRWSAFRTDPDELERQPCGTPERSAEL